MRALTEHITVWIAAFVGAALLLGSATVMVLAGGPARAQAFVGTATEPYGGCKEAWQAPRSPGARLCRQLGYTVSARFLVNPRGVVLRSTLPHCRHEDGSGGPRPCTWNIGRRVDGNGHGLAYKVRRDLTARYVWAKRPTGHGWRWVSRPQAYELIGRFRGPRGRSIRAWQRCVARGEAGAVVKCPDGARYRV